MKNKLIKYLAIIIGVTLFLYSLAHLLGNFDKQYFELHKTNLTSLVTTTLPDGSIVKNYFYTNTPYHYAHLIVFYFSLFFPIILIWILAIRLMLFEISNKTLFKSLSIPIFYGVIQIIFFFTMMDKSLGWEYSVGMDIMFAEIIFLLITVFIINGAILLKNTIKNRKIN